MNSRSCSALIRDAKKPRVSHEEGATHREFSSNICENLAPRSLILGTDKIVRFQMANGFDLTTITSVLSITTFIIGILLGVIIKRALKLAMAIVSLVVLLVVTGYLNFAWSMPSANTIYSVFNGAQPIASQAVGLASLLPISSVAFLAGAAIGLWKG